MANIFITTTLGLGEHEVESASNDSIFAWSWQPKVVTMPRLPSFTLLVTKTAIGTISPLIFLPLPEMSSTPACPHMERDVNEQKVSLIQSRIREHPEMEAHGWTSTPLETTDVKKDLLGSPHSIWRLLVMISRKKNKYQ